MSTHLEQAELVTQDSTRFLQREFTGHLVAQPGMGYAPLSATVVSASTSTVMVTVDGFTASGTPNTMPGAATPTFECYYQPVPGAGTPPGQTKCFVAFAPNEPEGYGVVVCFRGWPTKQAVPDGMSGPDTLYAETG